MCILIDLTSGPEDEELRDEVEILYEYVRENLVITQDGKVNLLQHNVPEDFDLHYSRMSERKIYTVTSEDDEKFDVIICYESPRDIKKGDYDDTKNSVCLCGFQCRRACRVSHYNLFKPCTEVC